MLKRLLSYLKTSKLEPLKAAFNHFYEQLLASIAYPTYQKNLKGPCPLSYNLLSPREVEFLASWLGDLRGSLFDFGCGLGMSAHYVTSQCRIHGIDFSEVAIEYAQKTYPDHTWMVQDQGDPLPCDHLLALDSLYDPNKSKAQWIRELIKPVKESALIIQNLSQDEVPQIKGFKMSMIDVTQDFRDHLKKAQQALKEDSITKEGKKFPLLWDTMAKEIDKHQRQKNLQRMIVLYEKDSS